MLNRIWMYALAGALAVSAVLLWRYDLKAGAASEATLTQTVRATESHEEARREAVKADARRETERRSAVEPVRAKAAAAMQGLKVRRTEEGVNATPSTARSTGLTVSTDGLWLDALRAGNAAIESTY